MRAECVEEVLSAPVGSGRFDPRLEIHPDHRLSLQRMGLTTAEAILALPGEIVSGHPDRHVVQVRLPDGRTAFLKREHRVRTKERVHNWLAGNGWSSKSVREGRTLRELERLDLPSPRYMAFGESRDGRAFLLLVANDGVELPTAWGEEDLAADVGRAVGNLHEHGVDHRDLFGKHVLLTDTGIVLLDWHRATVGRKVGWRRRVRSLGVLLASLPDSTRKVQTSFFSAYADRCGMLSAAQLETAALCSIDRLRRKGKYRELRQRPLPTGAQRLIWLDGEAICAVPESAAELSSSTFQHAVYDLEMNGREMFLADGRAVKLSIASDRAWVGRLLTRLRGRAWRSRLLRQARLLFHLERHHLPAPRLIAYGQRPVGTAMRSFVLAEALRGVSFAVALSAADEDERHLLLSQLADLLARVHEAGCVVGGIAGVRVAETGLVIDPNGLRYDRDLSSRCKRTDWRRVALSMKDCCGPHEVRKFLDLFAEGVG